MKIVKSFEESGLLIRGVSKTNKNEAKEQKGEFLGLIFGTLCASLLGYLSTRKSPITADEDTIRASHGL